jgi:hypothetical protein
VRLSIRSWSGRRPMLITLLDAPGYLFVLR